MNLPAALFGIAVGNGIAYWFGFFDMTAAVSLMIGLGLGLFTE